MFAIEDIVVYGNCGVCKIVNICKKQIGEKQVSCYVLKPVRDETTTIYCPIDNDKIKMRKLLTPEEIDNLIQTMPAAQTQWEANDQIRKEKFHAILKKADHRELITLIKTLYFHKVESTRQGRKFHLNDERVMKEAERILYGEFAHVLHIEPDEVVPFITGQLNAKRREMLIDCPASVGTH